MKKTIANYDLEEGIIINCTQIKESEHEQVREEIGTLGFSFETIDSDSFNARYSGDGLPDMLRKLEKIGYSF